MAFFFLFLQLDFYSCAFRRSLIALARFLSTYNLEVVEFTLAFVALSHRFCDRVLKETFPVGCWCETDGALVTGAGCKTWLHVPWLFTFLFSFFGSFVRSFARSCSVCVWVYVREFLCFLIWLKCRVHQSVSFPLTHPSTLSSPSLLLSTL